MKSRWWYLLLVVVVTCLTTLAHPSSPSSANEEGPLEASRADRAVLHRVVWDERQRGRTGYHLRSARLDGTDKRRVYDSPTGFTTALTMDPKGRWVAFSPCCRQTFPTMVVARVRGGEVLTPLANHPRIYFVGGIGWSPNGRRIAFEGMVGAATAPRLRNYLLTVRPDGTGLRRVHYLGSVRRTIINDALAWTPDGILYSDGRNLMSANSGGSHLVMRRVRSVRISGDGEHIVTERFQRRTGLRTVWFGNPDGTEQRRIIAPFEPGEDTEYYGTTPNFDGSALVAERTPPGDDFGSDVVTWNTDADPDTATVLEFVRGSYVFTWN